MMQAIILMTRIPYPGFTKTRLMKKISGNQCADLHKSFLEDNFRCLEKMKNIADLFVAYAPENFEEKFLKIIPSNFKSYVQEGENIGERMYNAFEYLFNKGYSSVILIGSDIPHIQPQVFRNAFKSLRETNLVVSPTYDGGYCLIGLNKNYKELFLNDLRWGNQSVINNTFRIANELGLSIDLLEKHRDLDYADDLIALLEWSENKDEELEHFPYNTIASIKEIFNKNGRQIERHSG